MFEIKRSQVKILVAISNVQINVIEVDISKKQNDVSQKHHGNLLSTVSMSSENRDKMWPIGLVMKDCCGEQKTLSSKILCNWTAPER